MSLSYKIFGNKEMLPLYTQSIRSEFIRLSYEVYVESVFEGWNCDEVGLFMPILMYAPDRSLVDRQAVSYVKSNGEARIVKKTFINLNETPRAKPALQEKPQLPYKNSYVYKIDNKDPGEKFDKEFTENFGKADNNLNSETETRLKSQKKVNTSDVSNGNIRKKREILDENGSFSNEKAGKNGKIGSEFGGSEGSGIKKDIGKRFLNDNMDDLAADSLGDE